jgi:hypothetical protein
MLQLLHLVCACSMCVAVVVAMMLSVPVQLLLLLVWWLVLVLVLVLVLLMVVVVVVVVALVVVVVVVVAVAVATWSWWWCCVQGWPWSMHVTSVPSPLQAPLANAHHTVMLSLGTSPAICIGNHNCISNHMQTSLMEGGTNYCFSPCIHMGLLPLARPQRAAMPICMFVGAMQHHQHTTCHNHCYQLAAAAASRVLMLA